MKKRDYEAFEIDQDTMGLIYQYMFINEDPKIELVTKEGTTDKQGKWLAWNKDTGDDDKTSNKRKASKQLNKKKSKK